MSEKMMVDKVADNNQSKTLSKVKLMANSFLQVESAVIDQNVLILMYKVQPLANLHGVKNLHVPNSNIEQYIRTTFMLQRMVWMRFGWYFIIIDGSLMVIGPLNAMVLCVKQKNEAENSALVPTHRILYQRMELILLFSRNNTYKCMN